MHVQLQEACATDGIIQAHDDVLSETVNVGAWLSGRSLEKCSAPLCI